MEDGYRLWLRYEPVSSADLLRAYRAAFGRLRCEGDRPSPTLLAAREELTRGLTGLLGLSPRTERAGTDLGAGLVAIGTPGGSPSIAAAGLSEALRGVGEEGFVIRRGGGGALLVAANRDIGVLYGVFHFLRLLQTARRWRSWRSSGAAHEDAHARSLGQSRRHG